MWLNHEYRCECTWQMNSNSKTAELTDLTVGLLAASERYWASFQVTRLFHNATVSQCDHFFLLHLCLLFGTSLGWLLGWRIFLGRIWSLPRFGGGALRSSVFTAWCPILISRPPRVFGRHVIQHTNTHIEESLTQTEVGWSYFHAKLHVHNKVGTSWS